MNNIESVEEMYVLNFWQFLLLLGASFITAYIIFLLINKFILKK